MPSKTATMLNCGHPIVTAVDLDSSYADMLGNIDNCSVVSYDDSESFAKEIKKYHNNNSMKNSVCARKVFLERCSIKNASLYAQVLTEMKKEGIS